jgi:hypothetical protein
MVCLNRRKSYFSNPFSIFADNRAWNSYCFVSSNLMQKDLT